MSKISTSLVVGFGSAPSISAGVSKTGFLICTLDSRPLGLNSGKSSFVPGDTIAFLVYSSASVANIIPVVSLGTLVARGSATRTVDEFVIFSNSNTQALSFPAVSGFTSSWVGLAGGAVALADESTLTLPAAFTGVLSVQYTTSFLIYEITNIPLTVGTLTAFPIVVFVQGEVL